MDTSNIKTTLPLQKLFRALDQDEEAAFTEDIAYKKKFLEDLPCVIN